MSESIEAARIAQSPRFSSRCALLATKTAIAVAYGYASREDLTNAGPDRLLDTPADLAAWCRAQAADPTTAPEPSTTS